jgi:hypothetical protein
MTGVFSLPMGGRPSEDCASDHSLRVVNVIVNHDLAPHRSGYSRVCFPQAANQTLDVVTALTSSTAVFAGHEPDIMNGFILAAVQCVASADRARLIRNDAHRALLCHGILRDRTALGAKAEREPLSELADNLGRLELELSFAVEAYLDVGLVLPDERLSAFQRDLGAAMAIPEAAMACADMLSRLGAGVEASRVQVEKREREEEEKRSAKLTWTTSLVAAVAVPLTLVFSLLGANSVHPADNRSDWSHSRQPPQQSRAISRCRQTHTASVNAPEIRNCPPPISDTHRFCVGLRASSPGTREQSLIATFSFRSFAGGTVISMNGSPQLRT